MLRSKMNLRQRQQDICFGIVGYLKLLLSFFYANDGLVLCGRNNSIEIDYLIGIS